MRLGSYPAFCCFSCRRHKGDWVVFAGSPWGWRAQGFVEEKWRFFEGGSYNETDMESFYAVGAAAADAIPFGFLRTCDCSSVYLFWRLSHVGCNEYADCSYDLCRMHCGLDASGHRGPLAGSFPRRSAQSRGGTQSAKFGLYPLGDRCISCAWVPIRPSAAFLALKREQGWT